MATVELDHVCKTFSGQVGAVSDLNLLVADGEFVVVVGPSGCGKTTTLRMVAGLESVDSGTVRIGDRVVNDILPRDRDIAMIFQNYALYPHMTVANNIAFALKMHKTPKNVIVQKVREAAELLQLTEFLNRKPGALSGGQRQRVAMGRAIVREPLAFLMDEPLSNLDAKLRGQMRSEITRIHRHLGVATLYVTHDQVEAMSMGDRVAVLNKGILQQLDTPEMIYDHPANLFVAGFIGSPSMNLYEGRLVPTEGGLGVAIGDQLLAIPKELLASKPRLGGFKDQPVVVGIRPECLAGPIQEPLTKTSALKVAVGFIESLGSELIVQFRIDAKSEESDRSGGARDTLADDVLADTEAPEVLVSGHGQARIGRTHGIKIDEEIWFSVDTQQLYFFDASTGQAIGN
ncbi:MAG: ABC transporter ATP-binding protein [Acidimicrobiales bacterium]